MLVKVWTIWAISAAHSAARVSSLQPLTLELDVNVPLKVQYKLLKWWQWYKTRTKLYLICSPLVLNKLIVSHSSSAGDKLQASDSEVHNRKARNCQGEWLSVQNWGAQKWNAATRLFTHSLHTLTAHTVDVIVLIWGGWQRTDALPNL